MNWYLKAFENYFNFKGRARRKEFWMFLLFQIIILISIFIIQFELFYEFFDEIEKEYDAYILLEFFLLISTIPFISVTVRRYHDTGRRGFWIIALLFIPIASFFGLAYLFEKGNEGTNKFGINPKKTIQKNKTNTEKVENINLNKEKLENEISELNNQIKRNEISELEEKLENLKRQIK